MRAAYWAGVAARPALAAEAAHPQRRQLSAQLCHPRLLRIPQLSICLAAAAAAPPALAAEEARPQQRQQVAPPCLLPQQQAQLQPLSGGLAMWLHPTARRLQQCRLPGRRQQHLPQQHQSLQLPQQEVQGRCQQQQPRMQAQHSHCSRQSRRQRWRLLGRRPWADSTSARRRQGMRAQDLGQLPPHRGLRSAMCCRLHHRWRRRQRQLGLSCPQLATYTRQARSQLASNRRRCPRWPTRPLLASRRCRRTSSQQQGRPTCLPPHHCNSAAAAAARSPAPAAQPHPATQAAWAPDLAACCTWEGRSPHPAAPLLPHSRRRRRRRRRRPQPQLLLRSRPGIQLQGSQTGWRSHLRL